MERRSFVQGAGIAGILAAGVAPAVHAQGATIRWRLTSGFPKALDTIYGAAETFAKIVGDMTGGRFQITVAAPGELVPVLGIVDAIQNGTVEMAHTAPYYYVGKNEAFAFGTAIPFGLNARQINGWMVEGNGERLLREFYREFNIINFIGGNTGAQMGGFWRKEIKSLADLRGQKMRIGGFGGRVMERIGVVPQMIPGPEIYQSLERGVVDAAEWVGPYDDEKLGLNKVAQFYAYPGFWEGGAGLEFWINSRAWDTLSNEYKHIVEAASTHAATVMMARYDARNPAALKKLVAGGSRLFRFPKDVMDAAFKASQDVYADIGGKNAAFKKIHDDYMAFRRDANLWFRFSEATFDDFMQSQRL
jgi:TRAP-type mannitol/chloroaromatic compound transport system substrate-binding protein